MPWIRGIVESLWFKGLKSEMLCTGSFFDMDFLIPSSPNHPTPAVTWSAFAVESKAYLWSHDHSQGFKIAPRFVLWIFGGWGVLAGNWWTSQAPQFFEWWMDQQKLNLSQFFQVFFFESLVANSSLVPLYWSLVDFCSGFLQSLLWEACWTKDFMGFSSSVVKPKKRRIDLETSQFTFSASGCQQDWSLVRLSPT